MSHAGHLHSPLQMFSPENGLCNYLALETIYGMLILWIHAFSLPELKGLYAVYLKSYLTKGGHRHQRTIPAMLLQEHERMTVPPGSTPNYLTWIICQGVSTRDLACCLIKVDNPVDGPRPTASVLMPIVSASLRRRFLSARCLD